MGIESRRFIRGNEAPYLAAGNSGMPKRLRVLQIGSPAGLYGAERWILALVGHLDPERIESFVGVIRDEPGPEPPLVREAASRRIRTHIFESPGKLSFSAIPQLRKFIRGKGIDILHTHYYKADMIGLIAARGTDCKIISTPHGWTQRPDPKLRIYEALDRLCFPLMDAVIPLSEKIYHPLEKMANLRQKLYLIRNGVDIAEVDAEKEIHPELREWKAQGFFIIGYIGRLISGKGIDTLLQALGLLGKIRWKLAIVGEGDAESRLRTMAGQLPVANDVVFFGFQHQRLRFLKGFDLFVLPSRSEGTPRCLMEAMSARIPVIASDIPGCRNLVADSRTGMLFPVESPAVLAEKIMFLAERPRLRQRLSANGREFIARHFSAERMARDYQQLYSNVIRVPHADPS